MRCRTASLHRVCHLVALSGYTAATSAKGSTALYYAQAGGECLSEKSSSQLLDLLLALPHGVDKMSHVMDSLVETSCNLASATLDDKGSAYTVRLCATPVRCPAACAALSPDCLRNDIDASLQVVVSSRSPVRRLARTYHITCDV